MNAKRVKKYKLVGREKVDGRLYWRIEALRDIPRHGVRKGDKGGLIEKVKNLSQYGNSWVSGNAIVSELARVRKSGLVCGDSWVCGTATVYGWVGDNALVCGGVTVVEGQRVGMGDIFGF